MPAHTIVFHVGFPKTGTTTLQGGLFTRLPDVAFVGKFAGSGETLFSETWVSDLRDIVNYADDFHVADRADQLSGQIAAALGRSEAGTVLVSLEGFTNPLVDTGYTQAKDVYRKAAHLREITAPLAAAGTRVRVAVGLRPQTDLMPSLFSQTCYQGVAAGLFEPSYDSFLDFALEDRLVGFGPALFFDRILDDYHRLFGAENVTAFTMGGVFQGEMTSDVAAMADLFGLDPAECLELIGTTRMNVRAAGNEATAKRRMMTASPGAERLRRTAGVSAASGVFSTAERLQIRRGKPVYWQLTDRTDRIQRYYEGSNSRLKALHGIDL